MDAMADVLPADLWLSRIEEKGQQLRLGGTTYSSLALSDFMSSLKASGKFKDVDLVSRARTSPIAADDHLRGELPVRDLSHGFH